MGHHATATTSETQTDTNPRLGEVSDRVRAHNASRYAGAVKRFELVPVYVWDELEPTELQRRSEWHDPGQPGDAAG